MIKAIQLKKTSDDSPQINLKEVSDYEYVPKEFSTVTITDQEGINHYTNNNFCTISKSGSEELIVQDRFIINLGYYLKPNPHAQQDQTEN